MKRLVLLFSLFVCIICVQMSFAGVTGKAKGTPLKKPDKPANVVECLDCHSTVKMLYDRGAHSKVNCAMCHESAPEHISEPSAANRPKVRTDHRACATCHEKELAGMLDPKYHMAWAKRDEAPTYSLTRNSSTSIVEETQYRIPRFHVGILADISVNRSGGRFKYKNSDTVGKPVERLWDVVYDSRPEDGDVIKSTDEPPLAWRPHKSIGNVTLAYCLKCKSTDNMLEYAYAGVPAEGATLQRDSSSMPTLKTMNSSFNCNFCHDPHSAEPRIVNEFLIEALINPEFKDNAYQKNVGTLGMTRVEAVEMGERGYTRKIAILERYDANFMCGQCHMSGNQSGTFRDKDTNEGIPGIRSFNEPGRYTTPFKEGPLEIYEYYKEKNWYSDIHPVTGTKWGKPRDHANVEILTQSMHGKAGVGCTDCHFAKVSPNYSEHQPSLPKEKVSQTCMRTDCHGKGTEFNWTDTSQALYRIESIQQKARIRTGHWTNAADSVIEYIKDINMGLITVDKQALDNMHEALAKSLTLEMYWFTDLSGGFHDPDLFDATVTAVTRELNSTLAAAKKTEKRVLVGK